MSKSGTRYPFHELTFMWW